VGRAQRKRLEEAIKEQHSSSELSVEVEWTMRALSFLKTYEGQNPTLRSLASRAKRIPNWVPTERQVVQIHRMVHNERIQTRHDIDSLGRVLRRREGPRLPDSLEEPDWLD
jgi:hypothetical protein